jgi:glycosyltransferase involved in cell wall biosynthesis
MKIAQVSPLFESVPPRLYGGTERIVSVLTEELVRRGHEVTLFASGDSQTSARLVAPVSRALRLGQPVRDWIPYHVMLLEEVRRRSDGFDVIHFHTDLLQMPIARELRGRALTTLHGRLDLPDLAPFYRAFPDAALVSISDDQRRPMPPVNWLGTVHHGLPSEALPFSPHASGGYLAFLGRISPEKRPDRAIEIASRTGLPLRIAAKVDPADQEYWDEVIGPMVDRASNVEFVGEIGEAEKGRFLGDAAALLFPIDWPEPFGLVMIEAMACGTPVIAFECGSVPEVIEHGTTGFVVRSVDEAVRAVGELHRIDRAVVHQTFQERFSVGRMARDYERIYSLLPGARAIATPVFRRDGTSLPLQGVA